jgi:hypothetical protein
MNKERSRLGQMVRLACLVLMIVSVCLFESYVIRHSGLVSDKPFTRTGDFFLFLICVSLPFLVLYFMAAASLRFTSQESPGRTWGVLLSVVGLFTFSLLFFFRGVSPVGWGMDQGTATVMVIIFPIVAVPCTLVLYATTYVVATVLTKVIHRPETEITNDSRGIGVRRAKP